MQNDGEFLGSIVPTNVCEMDPQEDDRLSSHVLYIQKVIPEADELFMLLRDEIQWREIVWKAGRKLPRLCASSVQLTSEAGKLLYVWVQVFFQQAIVDDIFANYYRDGKDYLPHHRDQYGDSHVVSLSFGATRTFRFSPGNHSFDLSAGDVIVFDPHECALYARNCETTARSRSENQLDLLRALRSSSIRSPQIDE